MAFSQLISTPVLTTVHGPMLPGSKIIWNHYNGYYNTISCASRAGFPQNCFLGVVYNGIDVESFPFDTSDRDDYLLFLGRISSEKGAHLAIDVARRLGQRLILAGKVDRVDQEYYERDVAPHIDGFMGGQFWLARRSFNPSPGLAPRRDSSLHTC